MHEHTTFEWICLILALPWVFIIPAFVLAPLITGTVKPLIDDWIGMDK